MKCVIAIAMCESEGGIYCCAGQIGYALAPLVARGQMLGKYTPIILHLLDIPSAAEVLNGVKMELQDGAFPLLQGEEPKECFVLIRSVNIVRLQEHRPRDV